MYMPVQCAQDLARALFDTFEEERAMTLPYN